MTDFVAGVDGGGSKTRVILADIRGKSARGRDRSRLGDGIRAREQCAEVIGALVQRALNEAGVIDRLPKVLVAGVAGVGRPVEDSALDIALDDLEIADEVVVAGDGEIALTDAFGPMARESF